MTETPADRVRAMVDDLGADPAALAWPYQLTNPESETNKGVRADLVAILCRLELLEQRLAELPALRLRIRRAKGKDLGTDYRTAELASVGLPPEAGWLLAAKDEYQARAKKAEAALWEQF